jgi:Calx-beta domain/Domain of unknown function (DUF4214)
MVPSILIGRRAAMHHPRPPHRARGLAGFALVLSTLTLSTLYVSQISFPARADSSPSKLRPTQAAATLQFDGPAISASEGARGVRIAVSRSGDDSAAVSVDYATGDGTASGRSDYIAAFGTLDFAAGERSKSLTVLVTDDASPEGDETFILALTNPTGGARLGSQSTLTVTLINDDTVPAAANPIQDAQFFVRQHYLDFLNREPDPAGLAFWAGQITQCGSDEGCVAVQRVNVSAAFFLSIEFQQTGYLVYRFHQTAFNTREGLRRSDFLRGAQRVGRGVVVGQSDWEAILNGNVRAYAREFVQRRDFLARYPAEMPNAQLIDQLSQNTGGSLTGAERDELIQGLDAGLLDRAEALRRVAGHDALARREFNRAFVLMQYFGYLARNPDEELTGPSFAGYNFWLSKLEAFGGNYVKAEMVAAFISSIEYHSRFLAPAPPNLVTSKHDSSAITLTLAGHTVSAGNAIYTVHVQEAKGHGVGLFTITTGPGHPSGAGIDVLYGSGQPGTSFTTVRSHSSGVDYLQGMSDKASSNSSVFLDAYGTVTPLGGSGFRTTYVLPGPPATADALTIVQEVNVVGSTLANSSVEVRTRITNRGAQPVQAGVRHLFDSHSAGDDGPTFQDDVSRQVWTREAAFSAPTFPTYTTTDNDGSAGPQGFQVVGTARGPVSFAPRATRPDLLQFTCWPKAFGTAFDYAPDTSDDNTTAAAAHQTGRGGGDSAVLYYFGLEGSPLAVQPAATRDVSVSLFAFSPNAVEPCACKILEVAVNEEVACIDDSFNFTATAQDMQPGDKIVWSAPGGSPAEGEGMTFSTKFATPGKRLVSASCEASSKFSSLSREVTAAAVASVTFEAINSPLSGSSTARMMFPDQSAPDDTVERRTVKAKALVTPVVAGVTVKFRVFDLDDPSTDAAVDENGTAGEDNFPDGTTTAKGGKLDPSQQTTAGNGMASTDLMVSRQPGNNFAVTATCNEEYNTGLTLKAGDGSVIEDGGGQPLPTLRGQRTGMLTVWRRLHIEVDSMGPVVNNLVSGNIIDLRDPGEDGTPRAVIVDNNLRDGSPDINFGSDCPPSPPSPALGLGRFENGTLTVAGKTIIANLNWNGCFRIERSAGMNIAAGGLPFNAIDNDMFGNDMMSGEVTSIVAVNGPPGFELKLNVTAGNPVEWPDFVDGKISIAGGPNMTIIHSSAMTTSVRVAFNNLRVPYTLVDDDMANGTDVKEPDLGQMEAAYMPAYVRPTPDAGTHQGDLLFIANVTGLSSADVREGWMFDASMHQASPSFWTVYLRGSFQDVFRADQDPNREAALIGRADDIGPVGQGVNIYMEPARAVEFTPDPAKGISEGHSVAHEIGHLFGALHNDGCTGGEDADAGCAEALLMAPTPMRVSPVFNGVTLKTIRMAIHP